MQSVGKAPLLLDVMMPGMNGLEVCERLRFRPETAAVPIIFVTALSQTDDKVRTIEAGGDDFLSKPFDRPVLLARIRSLLRLRAARDELEASYHFVLPVALFLGFRGGRAVSTGTFAAGTA